MGIQRMGMDVPHVVIIGGGFGGLTVAQNLNRAAARVTLIDRKNHHLFQPLLYQVATAGLSPADIAAPIRAVLGKQKNAEILMDLVIGIDPRNKIVQCCRRKLNYDYLVIATGSSQSYFGHPEWEKFAPGLKSISDATLIREKILKAFEAAEIESNPSKKRELLTFVLVGAGSTGVEMSGSLAELAYFALRADFRHIRPETARIILVEAGPRILAGFSEDLARAAERKLKTLGVEILTNSRVEQVEAKRARVSGKEIQGTLIWCAGVQASPAGQWLGAKMDRVGRVLVEANLTVPGYPEIFVIGDTACVFQDGKQLPGVAPVAMQEGRYTASIIRKKIKGKTDLAPFRYVNKGNLATVGRSFAIVEFGKVHIYGLLAWWLWIIVHIYYLIDFRNRVLVLIQWAWAYVTFQRGARLIATDPTDQECREL